MACNSAGGARRKPVNMCESYEGRMAAKSTSPWHPVDSSAESNIAWDFYALAIGFQQQVIEALKNHGPSAKSELKEAQRCLADLERQAKKPAGKLLKNDIPDHNITGNQSTEENVSDNEIENTEALKDHGPISINELKELQGLLAELEDLERQAQKPAGKPLKNDIPDHNITGNQSTEKNVRKNEFENIEASRNHGHIPIKELKELQGLLAELEHQERKDQKHAGKSLKYDIPDHSMTGNQSTEKNMSQNEIEITEASKELQGLIAELRRQTKKLAGKPIKNDIPDNKLTGKQSTEKISGNKIEKTGRISGKILTKKNVRMNETEDTDSISGKLMANLTKKNVKGNEIEDTGVSSTKS
ncbi:hypothetical protein KI387_004461 [Taxus chinensis]|uniref:Uncharacterized protein n=1 Tax=Taxus chinensis TaxID=29808 RepID=A0AA38GM25_TAXCH|nr:hypothetical protein KI387_004461 [Taxus chinensis]